MLRIPAQRLVTLTRPLSRGALHARSLSTITPEKRSRTSPTNSPTLALSRASKRAFSSPPPPPQTAPEPVEVKYFTAKSGAIGLIMGTLGGMVGIGGGVVAIPLMASFLRLTQHQSHGTSLIAVTGAALVGATNYYLYGDGAIDFVAAAIIAPTAALCAPLGVQLCKKATPKQLKLCMAFFTFSAAAMCAWKEYRSRLAHQEAPVDEALPLPHDVMELQDPDEIEAVQDLHQLEETDPHSPALMHSLQQRLETPGELARFAGAGAMTGVVSGLLGVGGGVVLLPLLSIGTSMNQQLVFGTVLTALVPTTILGSISHARIGNVMWRAVLPLCIGSAIGGYLGSRFSIYLNESQQRMNVVLIMTAVGLRSLLK